MILARNIRYLRQRRGWSLSDLANLMGYRSLTTVAKWESGVNEPPLKSVHELARIFNVDIDTLVKVDIELSNPVVQQYTQKTENPTAANDGVSAEKRELMNAILDSLNALSDEDLRLIGQVVETIRHRASPERSRD